MFDDQINGGCEASPEEEYKLAHPYTSNISNIPFSLEKESIELVLSKNAAKLFGGSQRNPKALTK